MGENGDEREEAVEDVFDIGSKERNPEALLRWRKATLVLNATRRFRYTARVQGQGPSASPEATAHRLEKALERAASHKMTPAQRFRTSGHALMAIQRFQEAGRQRKSRYEDMGDGFGLTVEQLVELNSEASVLKLKELGGVFDICRALRVDPEKGISTAEEDMGKRRTEFGANVYPPPPSKSFFMFAWEAAQDKTLILLMACAVVSLVAGLVTDLSQGWYDGVAIAVAILIVILVTATSDYVQSLQFRGLNAEKANIQLNILRDGRMQHVSIFDLLVGDIVPLTIGDQVPADGVVLSAHSLTIDESSMTGESDPIHKTSDRPFMVSGCKVVDGVGKMLVTAVGMNTEWGKVMATLNQEEESETPLQVRLNGLATGIGKLGLVVAGMVLVVLIIRYAVEYEPGHAPITVVKEILDIIIISITIIVVAVPEGLPLAVTLTLAFSMGKMMKDKALVRRLSACETMGCATTICSDKTGTLTLNQMTAVQEYLGGELQSCETGKAPGGLLWECLQEGLTQNGTASVFIKEDGVAEVTASPTEAAVVSWALKLGLSFEVTKEASSVIAMDTFNSTKKRGGVVAQRRSGEARAHWKGAAEIIVGLCSSWMDYEGQTHPLDAAMSARVEEAIQTMAASSLRCVGVAYRDMGKAEIPAGEDFSVPDDNLTLLTIIGIKDPCRPGVPESVSRCQAAGVKVRMVTGDNVLTARAIAGECNILTPGGVVIEGKDFRALSKEQMMALLPKIDVMARSSPTDKHLLVKTLRHMGEVVAVTGDGTNDAPALKEADIGLSMGIAGTEVAKESSDIVILDDNFTSIVRVVRWGRSVFANIQKFVQFQLTVNISALLIDFIIACTNGSHVPLTAVQLLWINLIMDTLAALALATEPPTDELLKQKPVGRRAPLITNIMWRNILLMSLYQVVVALVLYYDGGNLLNLEDSWNPELIKNTIIFNTFVFCQLFNEINARKPDKLNVFEGLHQNWLFVGVIAASVGLQVLMVEVLHAFANTASLTLLQWVFCIVVGFVSLPLGLVIKFIPVPKTPFLQLIFPKSWVRRRGLAGVSLARNASGRSGTGSEPQATPAEAVPLAEAQDAPGEGGLPNGLNHQKGVDGVELPQK